MTEIIIDYIVIEKVLRKRMEEKAMKNKKIVKKLFAGVMALSLCLGACLGTSGVAVAAPEDNVRVSLTKELKVASGIQTPEATFTFKFEQSITGQYTGANDQKNNVETDAASINDVNLKFAEGEDNASGKIVKESTNIFANGRYSFPHAGVYKFIVSEIAGNEKVNNGNGEGTMTYDANRYIMFVSVKNDGNGGLTVDNAIVQPEDPENPGEPTGGKKDATPGKDENDNEIPEKPSTEEGDDTNLAGTGNEFTFVNTYTKTTGEEPEEPIKPGEDDTTASALKVSKTVVGDMADLTQEFSFAITLNYPETAKDVAKEITAYRVDKDGIVKETLEFKEGTANPFKLSDGEYISFKELPAGTTYVVEETGTTNYTGSIITTSNNNPADAEQGKKAETLVASQAVVGEMVDSNSAAVTNTYDDQSATPTGIIVNNLPYVALLLVAVVGCVVIFAGRKRRSN